MNLRKKCWLVTEKTWKDGWLGTENLCWLDTEKTIGMKDNYLRHYQMLKIQWLTRYGKFEGMIDSARKNLKGWLTRHGKFKGMVDSARKTRSLLCQLNIHSLLILQYIYSLWLMKWFKMEISKILIASSISTFNLLFHSKMTDDLIQISLFLELTILL